MIGNRLCRDLNISLLLLTLLDFLNPYISYQISYLPYDLIEPLDTSYQGLILTYDIYISYQVPLNIPY